VLSRLESLQKQLVAAKRKKVAQCAQDQCGRSRVFNKHGRSKMASNITGYLEYWQKRAEEARTLAEQMMDTHTKSIMLGIAASYEKIAKWTAERRDEPR
jgi:hypothetical protein